MVSNSAGQTARNARGSDGTIGGLSRVRVGSQTIQAAVGSGGRGGTPFRSPTPNLYTPIGNGGRGVSEGGGQGTAGEPGTQNIATGRLTNLNFGDTIQIAVGAGGAGGTGATGAGSGGTGANGQVIITPRYPT